MDMVQPSTAQAQPVAQDWHPLFHFFGVGSELFWLFVKNFFFSLFTLGIYSFWGKTNIRRYVWSKTYLLGEPFEYTGTGKELFISFLIVIPVFVILMALYGALVEMYPLAALVFMPLFLFLAQFAIYRTIRYRLTRTRWRGIRCNLSGSATTYALYATLYTFAAIFTIGILGPWAICRTTALQVNNVYFGSRKLDFSATAKSLYVPYFLFIGGMIVIIVLASFGIATSAISQDIDGLMLRISLFYLAIILYGLVGSAFLSAAITRWFFNGISHGQVYFRSTLSGLQLLMVRMKNLFIIVFTLGFGYAWAYVLEKSVTLASTSYQGDLELSSLLQDTQPVPKRGEGLLEALDMDLDLAM